jgi:hypothetical protein
MAATAGAGNFDGVGNGNRTRNRRSHSPVLCQLSYSHRKLLIIATAVRRRQRWMRPIKVNESKHLDFASHDDGVCLRVRLWRI